MRPFATMTSVTRTLAPRVFDAVRSVRLQAKTLRWLTNWREVWRCHRAGRSLPPLRFRSGLTLYHRASDGPMFLLFEIFANGCYRRHLGRPRRGLVIDIGANIGAFSLDVCQSESVVVHAYEPHPETYAALRRNLEANGLIDRVTSFNCAVGAGTGELRMAADGPSLTAGRSHRPDDDEESRTVGVPMVGLDEVIARVGVEVELLKIDTEGAEAEILEGAPVGALRKVRRVAVECHDWLSEGASGRSRRALERAGFTCRYHADHRCGSMLYAWRGEETPEP